MKGKVAIVTGGSRSIGKTICEVLAKEGATVYFCSLKEHKDDGEAVAKFITEQGGKGYFSTVDVGNEQELRDWIDSIGKKEGRIDIVVPNAVAFVFGKIDEVDGAMWDKVLNVNVKGYANTVKFALPYIRKTNSGGSIVLLASVSSFVAQPSFVPYNSSKVIQFTTT